MLKEIDDVPDVPDVSIGWYRDVVGFAQGTPSWVRDWAEIGTDAIPALMAALFAVVLWRAWRGADRPGVGRSGADRWGSDRWGSDQGGAGQGGAGRPDPRALALALLGPVATVTAYLCSELIKSILRMPRPCWLSGETLIIATCPEAGDWSLPSNHATFAAAAATALVIAWRRMIVIAPALAVIAAASRVFVGVHYPHDVAVGFLLGVIVASLVMAALLTPATALVARLLTRLTPQRPARHRIR
ncbi:phosphatase PAP2 family protein [Sphaerimonospora mesophila]|uniref:phosphatase PAP2 family protein n=1 Tax=Sphaerimonospora mesophila TaxID=37483 RepID=UPI0006E40163